MRWLLLACLTAAVAVQGVAQDGESGEDPVAERLFNAATAEDVSPADLEDLTYPMTQANLEQLLEAWLLRLQEVEAQLSDANIAARKAEARDVDQAQQVVTGIREQRAGIVERFKVILSAYTGKGGDATELQAFVDNLSGLRIDPGRLDALWSVASQWLTSSEGGVKWAIGIAKFIAILIVAKLLASLIGAAVAKGAGRMKSASSLLKEFITNTTRRVVFLVGLVVALGALGIDIGPLVAAIGAVGFVIGFALQGTLSNFACGVMLLLYRPYDVGDVVEAGGVTGKVEAMSLVSTTISTPDNQVIVVPNSSIWGSTITNKTGRTTRRVDLVFGISYDDDLAKAERVLADVVSQHPLVLADPAPAIKLHELADSSVNFVVRPWSKTSDYWDVYWDLTRQVKERFDAEGLSFPYPQMDIHQHRVES